MCDWVDWNFHDDFSNGMIDIGVGVSIFYKNPSQDLTWGGGMVSNNKANE